MAGNVSRTNGKKGGRPKGTTGIKHAATIEKEAAREVVRQRVFQRMIPMIDAQIEHALGIKHFMLRRPDGKFERITDPLKIEEALNADEPGGFYIFTKDPSVQAFSDLMNRAIDKPTQQVTMDTSAEDEERRIRMLLAGRERNAIKCARARSDAI